MPRIVATEGISGTGLEENEDLETITLETEEKFFIAVCT